MHKHLFEAVRLVPKTNHMNTTVIKLPEKIVEIRLGSFLNLQLTVIA